MKLKKALIYSFRLVFSVLAFVYVMKTIGSTELIYSVKKVNVGVVVLALASFIFSQWVSTHRLGLALKTAGIHIPFRENFRLYFVGMAYNMFLTGGIGGDAYKLVYYGRFYQASKRDAFYSLLLDRLMGLLALLVILSVFTSICMDHQAVLRFSWIAVVPMILTAYFLIRWILPAFKTAFNRLLFLSFAVQIFQGLAALFLMWGMNITDISSLLFIFYLSCIAIVIPIFLGGIGAREVVFGQMAALLNLQEATYVGIAILFSLITLLTAIPGLILDWKMKPTV
jgi:uncharacterized membrane protein YbhN (UPF0104 family)